MDANDIYIRGFTFYKACTKNNKHTDSGYNYDYDYDCVSYFIPFHSYLNVPRVSWLR